MELWYNLTYVAVFLKKIIQTFLEMVDALARAESDKSLPKFKADEYNQLKIYFKRKSDF